ncbi:flagellar protein MotY [Metapseudomonas resinovorans]|uniref:flagellar protein MotY n=1 Tax=Metapseudomonas resinovorans TaxID=53412 RepID=UPI0004155670|nr:OmpA family protein [Pseudomonas resinovorans]MDE3735436.1 OmpA family protein [Pseudomonas resinovorans]
MRQRYLVFLSLFASLPAMAITFQTRLEKVEWKVEGDKFECRLSQPITDFGAGEFVRRAGEQATFRLKARERWMGAGSATLLAAAAPWQPGRGDINLGVVSVGGGEVPFNSSQQQAGRLLTGLLEGRSPLVRHRTLQGGDAMEVRLLPVKFNQAYQDYLACTAKLLPVNFDQIRHLQLGFPGGGVELDDMARAKLEIMLDFIKADPSVNHIEIDGHSDNSGNRLTNRDLSRRRALAVFDYFKANGFPEAQMVMRFHGERYPLAPNNSSANRAKNRRATVQLSRVELPVEAPATAPASTTTPAETPAPAAAPAEAPIKPGVQGAAPKSQSPAGS